MTITITTWNIQNFSRSDPVYIQKLDYLSSLGSDVVAIQEVLDADALLDLANELNFKHFAADPDDRGIRVAFLTCNASAEHRQIDQWQLPTDTITRRFDKNGKIEILGKFSRPAYQITVSHDNHEIEVITAHFKSKLLEFGDHFSTSNETLRAQTALFALNLRTAEATILCEHDSGLLEHGQKK